MDIVCADCGRQTEVVRDHSTGDTVCSECGLVLESHTVDETSEWRTFANDDNNDNDPNRVGKALNPLLDTACLTTNIENPKGTNPKNMVGRGVGCGVIDKSSQNLLSAFDKLTNMADRLGLFPNARDRGCELYKKVFEDNNKTCRGRNVEAVFAACLLVACQQENVPRTVKEICSVVQVKVSEKNKDKDKDKMKSVKKDVMKAKSFIMKQLVEVGSEEVQNTRTIRPVDLMKRFFSNLGIKNNRVLKAAMEASTKCEEEIDVRRSPISVAAALIYVIVQLADDDTVLQLSLKDVSIATAVAEGTIKHTFKDLYPHVSQVVPAWYANQETIEKLLCNP